MSTINEKIAMVDSLNGGDRKSYKNLSECQGAAPVLGTKGGLIE